MYLHFHISVYVCFRWPLHLHICSCPCFKTRTFICCWGPLHTRICSHSAMNVLLGLTLMWVIWMLLFVEFFHTSAPHCVHRDAHCFVTVKQCKCNIRLKSSCAHFWAFYKPKVSHNRQRPEVHRHVWSFYSHNSNTYLIITVLWEYFLIELNWGQIRDGTHTPVF